MKGHKNIKIKRKKTIQIKKTIANNKRSKNNKLMFLKIN